MPTRVIVSAAVMALSLACTALAQIQAGNIIRGKVRNSSGASMAHVRVDLEAGNGPLIQQTVTNAEGDFYFSNLPDTSYAVVISSPDYEPVTERVDFFRQAANSPGETRLVEITLVPKASVRPPRPGLNFVQDVPTAAQTAYESALKFSKQGKRDETIAALQEAIKIFPNYFNARFFLGSEFMKAGKQTEAITELEEARRINPRDDRIYELFGIVLLQQKKYAVAAAVFGEASRLSALDPQYPLMRGMALIEHASTIDASKSAKAKNDRDGLLTDAETSLKHAYDLSGKKLVAVHLQLARVYEKRGERERAAKELEQYLREAPDAKNADAVREGIKKLREPQKN